MVVKCHPLCRHLLNGYPGRVVCVVKHIFVPHPHMDPCLFTKRRFRRREGLNYRPHLRCPVLAVPLEDRSDPAAEETHVSLFPPLLLDLARLNPLVNEASGLCKYPRPTHAFPLRWFGYFPTEFCEKATHVACVLWWSNGEAVLVSKLVRVFPCQ